MSPDAAEQLAARTVFDQLQYEAYRKKVLKVKQAAAIQGIELDMNKYKDLQGRKDLGQAATNLIEGDVLSTTSSLVLRKESIAGLARSRMDDVLASFRRNMAGQVRQKAKLNNVVRELFGEDTGDLAARELSKAWTEAAEYLRKRFNMAGGAIVKMENWGLPQSHDSLAVRAAGAREWIDFLLGDTPETSRLDINGMIDETTGMPFTRESLTAALNDVWQTISTEGGSTMKVTSVGGGKSVANQRRDHRFLKFKNGDSWMEYQEKYGRSNAFDAMLGHIDSMARDIALIERFGPNPNATMAYVRNMLIKEAKINPEQAGRLSSKMKSMDDMYNSFVGKTNSPVRPKVASFFQSLRDVGTSAFLGATSLTAITDFNFVRLAKQFSGLPQTDTLSRYLEMMNPLTAEEKGRIAVSQGLIANAWTQIAASQARYVGDVGGSEITSRIADFTMRASLLSPHTQANQWAFGMSFNNFVAENRNKPWAALPENLRNTLANNNFRSDTWDIIRSSEPMDYQGTKYITGPQIEKLQGVNEQTAFDLATQYMQMINRETNQAVPSYTNRGRAFLIGSSQPGTVTGELLRSFAMFKNFGVTLLNTQIARGLTQPTVPGRAAYLADLLITTTIMGAFAIQLKEIAKGRDPRGMDSPEFWGAAFLQGGGLGIYGDFLFSNVNRYGSGLEDTIAGPIIGMANDVKDLTIGNAVEFAQGKNLEESKVLSEMLGFAAKYTPGSSIFYIRAALERQVIDRLEMMANPKARQDMLRLEKRYMREYGQRYWWRPGSPTPDRAPNLEAALGD
ncbi:MAG: hypothetical protein VW270_03370 [Candidatus Poseidoniales archaeon]